MVPEDLVRGKKRQRKKAPKTRTGCITCKIRRVKCDELRPSCLKCTSTGRKCDGYEDNSPPQSSPDIHSDSPPPNTILTIRQRDATKSYTQLQSNPDTYEPSNLVHTPPLPTGLAANPLPGRAFQYFIQHSSIDLTGPLHSQVWHEYALSIGDTSPAVHRAIMALSGFHERYTSPDTGIDEEQCWREYYLAVKDINTLIHSTPEGDKERLIRGEVLMACAVFITIEILLGNTEAAIAHLEGGQALIHQYLIKGEGHPESATSPPRLDDRTVDLIGWFTRFDLQVLSFLPRRHRPVSTLSSPSGSQLSRPLQNAPSASLYHLIKHSLYWIRYNGQPFKYSPSIPSDVTKVRDQLLLALGDWYINFSMEDAVDANVDAKTANLLVAYHLTRLKLTTSLTPLEAAFDSLECQHSFGAILKYCARILHERNPVGAPLAVEEKQNFFSLEASSVEPLYYLALKCRNRILRCAALLLLKCAGREGVWNGNIMSKVAKHIIILEEGSNYSTELDSILNERADCFRRLLRRDRVSEDAYQAFVEETCQASARGEGDEAELISVKEEDRVNSVTVHVDRDGQSVEVECGWFIENMRTWKHETILLKW